MNMNDVEEGYGCYVSGYSRTGRTSSVDLMDVRARYATLEELKALEGGREVIVLDRNGRWRRAKVNGKPKTWKTRPGDVRVALKYGLYEYGYSDFNDGVYDPRTIRILTPVN